MDLQDVIVGVSGIVFGIFVDNFKDYVARLGKTYILRRAQSRYAKTNVPLPDKEFRCFRFGNFEIPAMLIMGSLETPFHYNEVTVRYRPELLYFPLSHI